MKSFKFRGCEVHSLSISSWGDRQDVGYFHPGVGIFLCPEKGKRLGLDWQEIILHEFTHYLQWVKGKEKMEALGLGVEIPQWVKAHYPEHTWILEAEAFWVQEQWKEGPKVVSLLLEDLEEY